MNILLWVLQGLAALLYCASGVMKVFTFDSVFKWHPALTVVAAVALAIESLVFIAYGRMVVHPIV